MKPVISAACAGLLLLLSQPADAAEGALHTSFSSHMPAIESSFERWDICQQVDDLIDSLGLAGNLLPRLCGVEMTQSFSVGVASVSLAGTLQELIVDDGFVSVEGPVDISVDFTPVRIAGGRAPSFAPCDRGDFEGCMQPTISTFANFLASFVPAIDLEVPVPVRVCAPGTPIIVKAATLSAGRWIPGSWSGWTWHPPRYIPGTFSAPVIEMCHITDYGQLPTVTLPEVQEVVIDVYPHLTADMGLRVSGDGSIEIEIPVPYAGAKFGYGNSWLDLNLSAGVSLVLSMQVENAGADALLSFDEELHIRSRYTREGGWSQRAELIENQMAPALIPHRANLSIRAGVKLGVEATAMAHIGREQAATGNSASDPSKTSEETSEETSEQTSEGNADDDEPSMWASEEDDSTATEEEEDSQELPPLPVPEPVQCAAQWLADGASLQLGLETKAALVTFVEGRFASDGSGGFTVDAAAEFSHAESLAIPGMCAIDCASLAGNDNPACATTELFRLPIAAL